MSQPSRFTAGCLLLGESAASFFAFGLSAFYASTIFSSRTAVDVKEAFLQPYGFFFLSILLFFLCVSYFASKGHYTLKASWWLQVEHILFVSLTSFVLSTLVIYARQMPAWMAQNGLLWFFMPPCLILMRWVVRNILVKKGLWAIPTILVGNYEDAIKLVPALKAETYLIYDVQQAFFLDAGETQIEDLKKLYPEVRICFGLDALSLEGSYVLFCPNGRSRVHDAILTRLERDSVRFAYVPPVEGSFLYNMEPQRFFGFGIIALESRKPLLSGLALYLKDTLDRICATIALVLLSPISIAIAWVIKKDGGPAMYGHRRIGKSDRPFTCLKFRSMVINSQEILNDLLEKEPALRKEFEETYKLKNDPRVTEIGKFLRKTSLDELPQLINVLRGEMSLTGPRPIVENEKKYYAEKIHDYLSVRPGITGLWQVSGRSDTDYNQRVYLDSWYVKNWSLWNDMIILFKTILVVLKRKGAY